MIVFPSIRSWPTLDHTLCLMKTESPSDIPKFSIKRDGRKYLDLRDFSAVNVSSYIYTERFIFLRGLGAHVALFSRYEARPFNRYTSSFEGDPTTHLSQDLLLPHSPALCLNYGVDVAICRDWLMPSTLHRVWISCTKTETPYLSENWLR